MRLPLTLPKKTPKKKKSGRPSEPLLDPNTGRTVYEEAKLRGANYLRAKRRADKGEDPSTWYDPPQKKEPAVLLNGKCATQIRDEVMRTFGITWERTSIIGFIKYYRKKGASDKEIDSRLGARLKEMLEARE